MFKPLLSSPVLDSTERTWKAGILFQFLWGTIVIVTLMEAVDCLLLPQNSIRWLAITLVMDATGLSCLALNRQGRTQLASYLLLGLVFTLTMALAWTAGGMESPAIQLLPFIPLLGGLLLSWRAGLLIGVCCALFELGLVLAAKTGVLPASAVHNTLISKWSSSCFIIAMLLQLQYLAVSGINKALKAAQEELLHRQQTEAALRNSEAFRKRIFESSHMPIVVMDAVTLHYLECNMAAVQIYRQASREETLGKTPLDVSAPEQYDGTPSLEKMRFYVTQALVENTVMFEWRHRRPGGEI